MTDGYYDDDGKPLSPVEQARRAAAEGFAEAWIPSTPGDEIAGTVVKVDRGENEYGSYPIVTIDTGAGVRSLHCLGTVLANEVIRQRPQRGDAIAVVYHGTPDGKDYKVYRVVVHKPDGAEVDWSGFEEKRR